MTLIHLLTYTKIYFRNGVSLETDLSSPITFKLVTVVFSMLVSLVGINILFQEKNRSASLGFFLFVCFLRVSNILNFRIFQETPPWLTKDLLVTLTQSSGLYK